MSRAAAAPFQLVQYRRDWEAISVRLRDSLRKGRPLLAVDMESNGFFHYPERVCLIQLCTETETVILDPFGVEDLAPLGDIFADGKIEKVFHACDYDLRSFDRDYGFRFRNLFDTYVAAQLLAPETPGLAGALGKYLDVVMEKSAKLQRSDWSRRPLAPNALEYAALDVTHLAALRDAMTRGLEEKGRLGWAEEEFSVLEGIRFDPPPPPEEACFSAKGTFDLSPEELAVFRELYLVREAEARRIDRPPFKVAGNDFLLEVSRNPRRPLREFGGVNRGWLERSERALRDAIERGRRAGPVTHPSRMKRSPNPWRDDSSARWRRLKEARQRKAAELNIAPSTLWPAACIDRLALDPSIAERELAGQNEFGVRNWQREVLGPELRKVLDSI